MAKFLVKASYSPEGVKGLLKDGGTGRRKVVEDMVKRLDGTVESFYYGYGEADAYVIVDVPDPTSAIAVSLVVNASGAISLSTTPLITAEEIDEACKRTVAFRPPGS